MSHDTETKQATKTTTAPKPSDMSATAMSQDARIVKALAEARRARHYPTCYCRRFDGQYCNATDALWSRAANRQLEEMTP